VIIQFPTDSDLFTEIDQLQRENKTLYAQRAACRE
jgi:hypothetical protein